MKDRCQIVTEIDPHIRDMLKELSKEFDVTMKQCINKAIIEFLRKHGKNIEIKEL